MARDADWKQRRTEAISLVRGIDRSAIEAEIREQAVAEKFESQQRRTFRLIGGMILVCVFLGTLFLIASVSHGERPQPTDHEPIWSKYLAEVMNAESEVVLPDRSRVDILTKTTAYEVEWSDKKGESVYQALHYMLEAKRPQAGIIILERGDSKKDLDQLMGVVEYLQSKGVPIFVETVDTDGQE